ncbi:MAG: MBL fold metallo-hydrolase [Asgard group archaeon]|nr:MBL fold metallo-hydrolase [Asgard group archaeon]
MKIRWLGNSCLEITDSNNLLIDPHFIKKPESSPDYILVTHEHDDHINPEQISPYLEETSLFGPQTTLAKFDLPGTAVTPGEKIADIKVLESYCWGSEESVSYYYNGLLHTGDPAQYPMVDDVKIIFTACFPDYYDEYIDAFNKLKPDIVIPFHYDVEEDIEDAKGLIKRLTTENINAKLLALGDSISI